MRIIKCVALIIVLAVLALAENASLVGRWNVTSKTQNGSQSKITLEFRQDGSTITGKAITDNGDVAPIDSVTVDGDQFKFKIAVEEGAYTVSGTVKGDEVSGTFKDPRGTSGTFTAKRS
jgi:hypothetical protein